MKQVKVQNMTTGSPLRLIVLFALPLMFGNMFQQLYSVIDSMIVGRNLGVTALAALGATNWPNWVLLGMMQGMTQGFSIVIAQAFGAGDEKRLKKATGNAVTLSAIAAVVLLVIGFVFARSIFQILGTPDEIVPYALIYLYISYAGIPIIMAYNLSAAILRALGNGKTPLTAMAIASVINVVLDILFVFVFHWGIAGAAIATLIAQVFSAIFCVRAVTRIELLHLKREDLRLSRSLSVKMLILSAPMALQNFLIAGGGMVVQSVVNRFSISFIAGFTAGSKLHSVLEIATSSFGFAVTTYVGQNLGALRIDRIHKGVRSAVFAAVATSLVLSAAMLLTGRFILAGFVPGSAGDTAETIDVAYRYVTYMCVCLPVLYLLYVFRSALQGMGNTLMPMVSAMAELICRTGSALILSKLIGGNGVLLAEVLAWMGADVVLITSYFVMVKKIDRDFGEAAAE